MATDPEATAFLKLEFDIEIPRQTGRTKPSSESKEEPRTDFHAHACPIYEFTISPE